MRTVVFEAISFWNFGYY